PGAGVRDPDAVARALRGLAVTARAATRDSRVFLWLSRPPPPSTLFPYTTLFRSGRTSQPRLAPVNAWPAASAGSTPSGHAYTGADRKSTRLNSSHVSISYAVFCLKKKKQNR